MIILDTNVLSALALEQPDLTIANWLDRQSAQSVWTTSITIYELTFGVELLAESRKRRRLESALDRLVEEALEGRVLPFDALSAKFAGALSAGERRRGRVVEIRDAQIAGVAMARKATLATRNVRHFQGTGLTLVNPWSV